MKTLNKMRTVEKARLFHQLFTEQIPDLLDCMEATCKRVAEANPESEVWDKGLFGEEKSFTIVHETKQVFDRYKKIMHHNSRIFSDQLFDGNLAVFAVYCLRSCTGSDTRDKRR